MAFSNEEKQIIEFGKSNNKTRDEIMGALVKHRGGATPATPSAPQPKPNTAQRVGDTLNTASLGVREAVLGQGDFAGQNPVQRGLSATATAFNAVPQAALAASPEPVRNAADAVGNFVSKGFNKLTGAIGSNESLQKWVMENPKATDSIINVSKSLQSSGEIAGNILGARGLVDTAAKGGAVATAGGNTVSNVASKVKTALTPTAEQIALERTTKMSSGLTEQNVRLKSVDKVFNKSTITRRTEGGVIKKITPIDTFVKYDIAPVMDSGTIKMGDYALGEGELGKIRNKVSDIDSQITGKLKDSGTKVPISAIQQKAYEAIIKNEDFMRSGTVGQNLSKLESRFEDYQRSYGDDIDIVELNEIRKNANLDFNPDTEDLSRILGDTSRNYIYNTTPDGSVKKLLQDQGELLAAKKYAQALNGTKVIGGRLGNYAMRTAGAVVGSTISSLPVIGPVIGMAGGEFAARALQQSQFKSAWTELRAQLIKDAGSETPQ